MGGGGLAYQDVNIIWALDMPWELKEISIRVLHKFVDILRIHLITRFQYLLSSSTIS